MRPLARSTPPYEARFDLAGWHLLRRVLTYRRTLPRRPARLVDLGMGRGRDVIYLARRGFRTLGIDRSAARVARADRRAARLRVPIRTRVADLRTVRWRGRVDVVYSSCALNFLPRPLRAERFAAFQEGTTPGGLHAVNVFRARALRQALPETDPEETPYARGELRRYYRDWTILEAGDVDFDCRTPGSHHSHTVEYLVARKPPDAGAAPPRPARSVRPSPSDLTER